MYIKYIDLLDTNFNEYTNDENNIKLDKVNVFIGKNNSGKSRLMRKVLINEYNKTYFINENIEDFIELKSKIEELLETSGSYNKEKYKETYLSKEKIKNKVYRNIEDEKKLGLFICNLLYNENYSGIYNELSKRIKLSYGFSRDRNYSLNYEHKTLKYEISKLYIKIIEQIEEILPDTLYFPSSLSLRKLNNIEPNNTSEYHYYLAKMYYVDYFEQLSNFGSQIKTGQEVYKDMKTQLLGLNRDRKQFLEYEKYISENFFNGKEISIFIKDSDKNIYIKEENEKEYPIYSLGDGLQTLIIITYYLFKNNDSPIKIFIDEPEIHLHPGLQRLLISKLHEYSNCQFFISTHSSNLIDICDEYDDDTAIICVDKIEGKKYAYNSTYDDMDLYKILGIRPSSIILSNCTIWVEGPTDIYYISTFLKLYSKLKEKREFILGYNYNFAFNGSINIASKFDFKDNKTVAVKIRKLSRNNYIIFDSDNLNEENANFEKIKKIRDILGENCCVIEKLKTIENIIPPEILKKYFEENYNPKEKELKEIVLDFFEKKKREYDKNDYYQMDFIELMSEYINARKKPKDIKERRKYCKKMWNSHKYNLALYFYNLVENMTLEDQEELFGKIMTEFIEMIEKIYNFIEKNN